MTKKYYIDFTELTPEVEEFFVNQGANVYESQKGPTWSRKGVWVNADNEVYFGGEKIHFYAGTKNARVWFDDDTKGAGLIVLLKWNDLIFKHSIPKD
jgi:hypothetical protein